MRWTRMLLGPVLTAAVCCTAHPLVPQTTPLLIAGGPIRLTGEPVDLHLRPAKDSTRSLLSLRADEKVSLVLRGLHTNRQPGIVYQLVLGTGRDAPLVGTLNFFSAPTGTEPSGPGGARTFELTRVLRSHPPKSNELLITIKPAGSPDAGATPIIGSAEVLITR